MYRVKEDEESSLGDAVTEASNILYEAVTKLLHDKVTSLEARGVEPVGVYCDPWRGWTSDDVLTKTVKQYGLKGSDGLVYWLDGRITEVTR